LPSDKKLSTKKFATREDIHRIIYTQPMGDFFAKSRADIAPMWVIKPMENPEALMVKRNHPQFKQLFKELLE